MVWFFEDTIFKNYALKKMMKFWFSFRFYFYHTQPTRLPAV
jgi:hypothetical protein